MSETLQSLTRGLQVYKTIMSYSKPVLASTLSHNMNIDKSTMSRILSTLKQEKFITYINDSKEIIPIDANHNPCEETKIELLVKNTKKLLEEISDVTNECAYLGIMHYDKVIYINQIDKSNRDSKTRNTIGTHVPLYLSALGKAMLAFSNYELQHIKLNKFTNNTITNTDKLQEQLDQIRKSGFSKDDGEYQDTMQCIGVPLFNHRYILIGAVGISGNNKRITKENFDELGETIVKIVQSYTIIS